MFDIDRIDAMLAAAGLPKCVDLTPRRTDGTTILGPASPLAHGLAELEQKLGLPGVDSYSKRRYRTNYPFKSTERMTIGERMRAVEARMEVVS